MRYYLSDQSNPINTQHGLWKKPLPVSRQGNPLSGPDLTYGQYFSAVEAFCNTCPELFSDNNDPSFDNVSVFLEKHGAFYHPSRIAVVRGRQVTEYVLNVAISNPGRDMIANEFQVLRLLGKKYGYSFLPKVFACREVQVSASETVSMFLGEWFSAYHEFHVSKIDPDIPGGIRVWDYGDACSLLTADQIRSVYEQSAAILTACYDIQTFEQISSWHHAAGDFVVNLNTPEAPQVKLVTVRRYAPLIASVESTAEAILNGLLLFLLNLSIHMRLDRLDGIDDLCWIDDVVVASTLAGFFKGLALQIESNRIPEGFDEYFKLFMIEMTFEDMLDMFVSIVERMPSDSPDFKVIQPHLERHAEVFSHGLRTLV